MFSVRDGRMAGFSSVELQDEASEARAVILPERGALTASLFALGREWLYVDEATLQDAKQNVRGGVPVLFPSPGRLTGDAFEVGGVRGNMKQHGFARARAFRESARGVDGSAWVTLELRDDEDTRRQFPFPFRFGLTFSLREACLQVRAVIENTGDQTLPFGLGYHPYFAVPTADKAASHIPTNATRAWDNVAKQEVALARISLEAGEVDLHLLDHGSNRATFTLPTGTVELAGDFSRWVVWTLPGKDFVCLEPWTAPGNALNTGEGRIDLAPGEQRAFELSITAR